MEPNNFKHIVGELKNYGSKGFEEISFENGTPKLQSQPNFLFRVIRYLFFGGYQEKETVLKVVNFLNTNKHLIQNKSDVENLKTVFSNKFVNFKDKETVAQSFDRLISQIETVAKENPIFEVAIPISQSSLVRSPESAVIDVPADGNCLFYAIAVGLSKRFQNHPEIQHKLGWNVDPDQLTELLPVLKEFGKEILNKPAATLRAQAAQYLEKHQQSMNTELIEAIASHREASLNAISNAKSDLALLEKELMASKGNFESAQKLLDEAINTPQEDDVYQAIISSLIEEANHMQVKLEQAKTNVEKTAANIRSEEEKIIKEGNIQGYIELSKQDQFFCGIAQISALSQDYQIPIRIITPFGEQILNENSELPILTIKHVGGNHFQYVDQA